MSDERGGGAIILEKVSYNNREHVSHLSTHWHSSRSLSATQRLLHPLTLYLNCENELRANESEIKQKEKHTILFQN